MIIRTAELSDAALLAEMNEDVQNIHTGIEPDIFKVYSKDSMRELFETSLSDVNKRCFIAFEENVPAGYAKVSKLDRPESVFHYAYTVIYVEEICVKKEFIGRGIGKALINEVKSYAESRGVRRVELDYWCKNTNAGEFFESQGFTPYLVKLSYDTK